MVGKSQVLTAPPSPTIDNERGARTTSAMIAVFAKPFAARAYSFSCVIAVKAFLSLSIAGFATDV
ncbi:hypothetical protein K432DRAFT_384047 [Lepidopterella palustris CBS 459.81]|uniref:Uncharacterized protein n=1 Tax=Lepidopterella palustris CBS 459.81 TaxID=1314670 RepID=A0A8E2E6F4_9PEZI|nr:hypothetical protein K432DRAFT_384047 [Lepidopterella palustris CBS 459.81]